MMCVRGVGVNSCVGDSGGDLLCVGGVEVISSVLGRVEVISSDVYWREWR